MTERPRILALFGGVVLFGQERGNIEALAALRDQGCEVLCLISDAPWNTQIPRVLDERGLAWRKVPYVHLRIRNNLLNFLTRSPLVFLRANVRAFAIDRQFRATHFHVMNIAYILNFWIFLKLRWQKPVIFRVGDEPPDAGRWLLMWRVATRRATSFVANSGFVRERMIGCGIPGSMVSIIYNRPTSRRKPPKSRSPQHVEREFADFIYIGQIIPEKGVGVLVAAFSRLMSHFPTARLAIVGRIDEAERGDAWARDLREQIRRDDKLSRSVSFSGFQEDISPFLENSGVLVAPSLINEAFANVVMEAKQAGRPAIVFPRGGLPEMIQDGVDGLVCGDATQEALIEAMRVYLGRPELMYQHGEAARRSLQRFNVESFAERWLKVYEAAGVRPVTPLRTKPQ